MATKLPTDQLRFCPYCFATDEDGSWQHTVDEQFCSNCGAVNSSVPLPRWAVDSIRAQASWVGRRYYPNSEDHEREQERRALLGQISEFPKRRAEPSSEVGQWRVCQPLPPDGTREENVLVPATTEAAALAAARYLLTYVSQEQFDG